MQTTQDIQYHEVKYIIDKTYAQRNTVRQKISDFKEYRANRHHTEANLLRGEIKRSYALYKIYQRQMRAMYTDYLESCLASSTSAINYTTHQNFEKTARA